jgi:transposase
MIIIGADYHPAFQQIAVVDSETGELNELRLEHREGAEKFYRDLAAQGMKVRVGMEASGHARWFERLLTELHFELWIGDAAEIRSKRVRKQKTDRQDAQLLLRLLLEDRFPRVWVPSGENRDLRQLLWHRHRMVQTRTRIMNQLQAVALNEGLRCKKRLSITAIMIAVRTPPEEEQEQLESFRLAPWASRRRRVLLELLDRLNPTIVELSAAIEQEVEKCPEAQRLRTHPGVGSLVANRLRAIWDWCRRRNRVETDWEKGSPRSSLGITFRVLVLVFLLFLFSFVLLFFILLLFCHFTPLPK